MRKKILTVITILIIVITGLSITSCSSLPTDNSQLPTEISQNDWNEHRQYIDLSTGITMSYVEMGNKNGSPIILQHGTTDNSRSWSFAAPYFAKAGYHVYIPDLRSHGYTDCGNEDVNTTFTYAMDLNAFCEAKNIDKAIVVGHSLGSFIMQTFWMLYPQRVDKVVLVSSIPLKGYQESGMDYLKTTYIDPIPEDGHLSDSFMDYWYDCSSETIEDEIIGEPFDTFSYYMKQEAQRLSKKAWTKIANGFFEMNFSENSYYNQIDKSKQCLILHGKNDTMTKSMYQQELIDLLSNSEKNNVTFKEYPTVGHNIQFVTPKQSSNDIISWLKTGKLS